MLHVVGAFTFTVLIGTPIAFALIFSGLAYLLSTGAYPSTLSSYLFSTLNSSALLSIPFFILSAEILNHSGATKRLVTTAAACRWSR
jgi:C4-dicarboxylate transporter DctM subunit